MPRGIFERKIKVKSHRKGMSLKEEYGEERAKEIKNKMTESHTGIPLSKKHKHSLSLLVDRRKDKQGGRMNTSETCEKIRIKALQQFEDPKQRELRRQLRIQTMSTQQTKDTNIEIKIQDILKKNNIIFEKQKPLLSKYIVDIFIEPNIVIECDGDYWHNRSGAQEKDRIRDKNLNDADYRVLRFWEHEINNDIKKCFNIIKNEYEKNIMLRSI